MYIATQVSPTPHTLSTVFVFWCPHNAQVIFPIISCNVCQGLAAAFSNFKLCNPKYRYINGQLLHIYFGQDVRDQLSYSHVMQLSSLNTGYQAQQAFVYFTFGVAFANLQSDV